MLYSICSTVCIHLYKNVRGKFVRGTTCLIGSTFTLLLEKMEKREERREKERERKREREKEREREGNVREQKKRVCERVRKSV